MVVSELVRQQTILYHSESRSIPDSIVSLSQVHVWIIVRGKVKSDVKFGAKILIVVTGDGLTSLGRLSFTPYNVRAQALVYRRRHGCCPEVICADQVYQARSNRAFCRRHSIRLSGPHLGRPKRDPELIAAEKK